MRSRLIVFLVAAAALAALHIALLDMPFFWDELGQFVPAALDIARDGAWMPHSTAPNVHPPAVMAWLAAVWTLFGFSIVSTRLAMLLLAALGLVAVFLLAIRLSRTLPGAPAFWPPVLLLISPLFVTQSMMAQLDMPAMVFTVLALLLFLEGRTLPCIAVCTLLVLVKETSVIVPLMFAGWLYRDRHPRRALLFLLPVIPLAAWLCFLAGKTGHILGNPEFAEYNVFYPLHPVRLALACIRRVYTLFVADFHWAGTLSLLVTWRLLRPALAPLRREWSVVLLVCACQAAVVTVLGGATLERYLLPVLPIFYIAVAQSWTVLAKRPRLAFQIVLIAGLIASNFWSSLFWPFPYEDNLAMAAFSRLQAKAAGVVETSFPGRTITTAWPLSDALRRPDSGYVFGARPVNAIRDFTPASINALDPARVDVLIVYSRDQQPYCNLLRLGPLERLHRRFYGYQPQMPLEQIAARLHLEPIAGWHDRGQWIQILQRTGAEAAPGVEVRRMRLPAASTVIAQRSGTSVVDP
ncbi:MAG: hypothetical protein NTY38_32720 [Acidobacteria bacterium]|nr:hypothetical protein [Acidobacteriota bacterium]